jgi:hypothetical protein
VPKPISYCSASECSRRCHSNGLCSLHFQRWKRTGRLDDWRACKGCGTLIPITTGPAACNDCRAAKHRATERKLRLWADYRLGSGGYARLLAKQGGRCAICRTRDPGRGHKHFSVDHDHVTEQVRGLLCHSCNVGIGHLGDDPQRLRLAATYIEKHRQLVLPGAGSTPPVTFPRRRGPTQEYR